MHTRLRGLSGCTENGAALPCSFFLSSSYRFPASSKYLGLLTLSPFGLSSSQTPSLLLSNQMSFRSAAARVFRDKPEPEATNKAWKALEDRLASRQLLNKFRKLTYRVAKRFHHGREMINRMNGDYCKDWSEAMISCVHVELECLVEDNTLDKDTNEDTLVSSNFQGLFVFQSSLSFSPY